jgi:hypothetical protein
MAAADDFLRVDNDLTCKTQANFTPSTDARMERDWIILDGRTGAAMSQDDAGLAEVYAAQTAAVLREQELDERSRSRSQEAASRQQTPAAQGATVAVSPNPSLASAQSTYNDAGTVTDQLPPLPPPPPPMPPVQRLVVSTRGSTQQPTAAAVLADPPPLHTGSGAPPPPLPQTRSVVASETANVSANPDASAAADEQPPAGYVRHCDCLGASVGFHRGTCRFATQPHPQAASPPVA